MATRVSNDDGRLPLGGVQGLTVRAALVVSTLLVAALVFVALTAATWQTFTLALIASLATSLLVVKWRR